MAEKNVTRQLILEAAIDCIEKYGIDKVTTRKIAEQAGANIASINYYFRSKDELVAAALSLTINHMLEDVTAVITDEQQSLAEALENAFYYLLEGILRFPGISTAHLYKVITEKDYSSISAQALVKVFERLAERITHDDPQRDPAETRLLLSQILSAIMFAMLAPNFFKVVRKYQLTNAEHARNLAVYYTGLLLGASGK